MKDTKTLLAERVTKWKDIKTCGDFLNFTMDTHIGETDEEGFGLVIVNPLGNYYSIFLIIICNIIISFVFTFVFIVFISNTIGIFYGISFFIFKLSLALFSSFLLIVVFICIAEPATKYRLYNKKDADLIEQAEQIISEK